MEAIVRERELPPPTHEPKDNDCEHCKQPHAVLFWSGLQWLCPVCTKAAEENGQYHALTGDWR